MTPYEFAASPIHLGRLGVLLLSAGGGNPDVLGCFNTALSRGPKRFAILCTRTQTPLSELADGACGVTLHEFDLPTVKDGFLATNSLLATCILLARAYGLHSPDSTLPPATFEDLVHPGSSREEFLAGLEQACQPLWQSKTLVVLHGHATQAAAVDIESKFTEAAIGHVQVADYRNFAHGRHHWLSTNAANSAVLSLAADEDLEVAKKTLALLPKEIPAARFNLGSGVEAGLRAIALSLFLAGQFGKARGLDPGRPSVPQFGRKLYRLGGTYRGRAKPEVPEAEAVAIIRKAGAGIATLKSRGQLGLWRDAYSSFKNRINSTAFRAIVLDYDGTLCDAHERYTGAGQLIVNQLIGLLKAGVQVGIATGRGKSVRYDLRKHIDDPSLMERVLIGYHNGAEIGCLNDETQPPLEVKLHESLTDIHAALVANRQLANFARVEAGNLQVTLEYLTAFAEEEVWEAVQQALSRAACPGVTALRSSHSVDVLAPGVTKTRVTDEIRCRLGHSSTSAPVLCVGDRGKWPGNDFALLREPFSLSVDEVSSDPSTCWNLASSRGRFAGALREYLQAFTPRDGLFTVRF